MWKKVKIEGQDLLMKHVVNGTSHKILITDFIHLWYEHIQEDRLLLRCKEMNKLVEASDEVFLGYVLSLMQNERDNVTRSFSDSKEVLNLQTSLEGFKFRIKFLLTPATHFEYYEEVTCPLLIMVSELEKREQMLVDVIKNKDVEILEYKLEGGQISRKSVETVQFDLDAFSKKCAEDLSTTKSSIASHPSHALTPLMQDLLEKISAAPELLNNAISEECKHNKSKKTMQLKSPTKTKKLKIYDDDDDDTDIENGKDECKKEDTIEEKNKTKRESQPRKRQIKGKPNPKLQKVLLNL